MAFFEGVSDIKIILHDSQNLLATKRLIAESITVISFICSGTVVEVVVVAVVVVVLVVADVAFGVVIVNVSCKM